MSARLRFLLIFGLLCPIMTNAGFHEECRETVGKGRLNIETVANILAEKEIDRLLDVIETAKSSMKNNRKDFIHSESFQSLIQVRDDQPPCPLPNNTMFTTTVQSTQSTTVQTTTTVQTSTAGGTSAGSTGNTDTSAGPTTAAPPGDYEEDDDDYDKKEKKFRPKKLYAKKASEDPFSQYISKLHYYMSRENEVCNNQITDLNSITEDQLYGYFSTLASAHPGPFCSLCHRLTEEIHKRVFAPVHLLITDDEYHFSNLFYSHIPTAKSICSVIAPGCHEDYAIKIGNLTESVVCLECTACMSVTNVIQHKFLLQKKVVDQGYVFLRGNLFHNLCSELCLAFQPFNLTLFPNGFSYDGCQAVMKKKYYQIIEVATVILRPERLCSLEIQWCELNEQPNAIHCLREVCQEYFKDTPQNRWLCSQIPDRPQQADAFLNIRQTKTYKEKKDYHTQFEKRNLHDEL